jgi:tetratricopeptide (TPR) repeat protein
LARNGLMVFAGRIVVLVFVTVSVGHLCAPFCRAGGDLERGLRALRSGRPEVAIELWTRAIEKNPKSYAAHVNRGSAYLSRGYVLRGIRDWYEAESLCPIFAYGVFDGDFVPEAAHNSQMLSYVASLELDPEYIPSVVMMGAAYLDLGLCDQAAELYRKSIELTKNPLLKGRLDYWLGSLDQ